MRRLSTSRIAESHCLRTRAPTTFNSIAQCFHREMLHLASVQVCHCNSIIASARCRVCARGAAGDLGDDDASTS